LSLRFKHDGNAELGTWVFYTFRKAVFNSIVLAFQKSVLDFGFVGSQVSAAPVPEKHIDFMPSPECLDSDGLYLVKGSCRKFIHCRFSSIMFCLCNYQFCLISVSYSSFKCIVYHCTKYTTY
jgi:hypothetical protein